MHSTWKEWNKAYLKTKENLISQGFLVREIIVDLDELRNYCLMRGMKIDGKHAHNLYQLSKYYELKAYKKNSKILTKWNPLGDRAVQITDLNNYETEATDIVFHCNIEISPIKIKDPQKRVHVIVKDVLEGAFDLNLSDKECEKPVEDILKILYKK